MGKTTLIKEFVKDKPAIFYAAQEANAHLNLRLFSQQVYSFFGLPESTGVFPDWHDAFSFIADKAREKRFVLVIDEFPYLAAQSKSIGSVLQNTIDHRLCECKWKNSPTDANEINKLLAKKSLLPGYADYHFMFFSKSHFSESAIKLANERKNIRLVTLDMLF